MPTPLHILAQNMRMRVEEIRALAEEMNNDEPKAIMLRIASDYQKLVERAEKGSDPSPSFVKATADLRLFLEIDVSQLLPASVLHDEGSTDVLTDKGEGGKRRFLTCFD